MAAAHGARVALAARRTEILGQTCSEIGDDVSTPIRMDVTDERSVKAGFDAAEARFGPVNSVVVNAGLAAAGAFTAMEVAAFDQMFAVNVRGAFLTAREAGRRMIARQEENGRIVLIASIGAHTILAGASAYCASKAAVLMLGRSLAREWARKGVNVNVVCPGYVRTELNADWFDSPGGQRQVAEFPRRRLMAGEDLHETMRHLLSTRSSAVTGGVFTLDDGQSL
ncbi:2-(S)-hydroxypropyl-CoM dehydrogenase [compost metagenome]